MDFKELIPDDWESHFHFPDVTASPAFLDEFQGYCQMDIAMSQNLYETFLGQRDTAAYSETIALTHLPSTSVTLNEEWRNLLERKGFYVEIHDTYMYLVHGNRGRLQAFLHAYDFRLISTTTRMM